MDPLNSTTTKPPTARDVERPQRLNGFKPFVNFTFIVKDIPENLMKVVGDGIEEELKILFGVINGTNATSPNATASNTTALNSTGNATTASLNTAVSQNPVFQKTASVTTTPASQDPTITSASSPPASVKLPLNTPSVMAISTSTPLPANTSSIIPASGTLNTTSLANSTSPTNQTVTNSNSSLTVVNGVTASASGTTVLPKTLNATEQMVAGLGSELREMLSTLLLSID